MLNFAVDHDWIEVNPATGVKRPSPEVSREHVLTDEEGTSGAVRIFGIYPRKGAISVGSDADIVIWDPNWRGSVTAEADLSNSDYSVYEGMKVTGWPVTTIRHGAIVYDAARVTGRTGSGQLVSRKRWRLLAAGVNSTVVAGENLTVGSNVGCRLRA